MEAKPQTAVDVLVAARELISVSERWTQGETARDRDGRFVLSDSKDAVCWCGLGALTKAVKASSFWFEARDLLLRVEPGGIAKFNDAKGRTHAEVVALFDSAIALARKEG